MPTYEYRCTECGHTFEEFQSMKSENLVQCPNCGKPGLKRLMGGGGGMIFKGSGFYLTDYKSSGEKSAVSTSPTQEPKKEGKSEPKKETPADSKPTTPPPAEPKK